MDFKNLMHFMDSLTDGIIPGNSICIYKDNKEIFRYSSGYSDIENKIKMCGNELLYIYSCSKLATVTAALQLLERGNILLSDPLYEYIPEFKDMFVKNHNGEIEKCKNAISLRNLFTMTAGFDYDLDKLKVDYGSNIASVDLSTMECIKRVASYPLLFEPGTHWNYSLCHDILAGVVETVSGKKFSDYVKQNIFDLCGIKDSSFHISDDCKKNMAVQYSYEPQEANITDSFVEMQKKSVGVGILKRTENKNSFIISNEYDSGGAGIITKVGEYAKFVSALANGGISPIGERILSKYAIELMRTNQLSGDILSDFDWLQLEGYGYGLGVRTMIDRAKGGSLSPIGEFGWSGAAGATAIIDSENRLGIFYAHHMLNPLEDYYQPRLRNVIYSCIDKKMF